MKDTTNQSRKDRDDEVVNNAGQTEVERNVEQDEEIDSPTDADPTQNRSSGTNQAEQAGQ